MTLHELSSGDHKIVLDLQSVLARRVGVLKETN